MEVAIVARIVRSPKIGMVAFEPAEPREPGQPELNQCLAHGRVILFAGKECPACKQIADLKFADV